MSNPSNLQRREFLKKSAAGAGVLILPSGILSGKIASPNSKLNIAMIGVEGRAKAHYRAAEGENVVAICDIDDLYLDMKGKIATQIGTQRHANANFDAVRKLIREGAIGVLIVKGPTSPGFAGRRLGEGTFAIQAHDPNSEIHFKDIRVKAL